MKSKLQFDTEPTTRQLMAMYDQARQSCDAVRGHLEPVDFLALWERSLRTGRNPDALFAWLLRNPRSWASISDDERARARQRIRDYEDVVQSHRKSSPRQAVLRTRKDALEQAAHGAKSVVGRRVFVQSPEALMTGDGIARDHEHRIRERRARERRSRLTSLVVVVGAVLWFCLGQ